MNKISGLILLLFVTLCLYSQTNTNLSKNIVKPKDKQEAWYEHLLGKDFPVSELTTIKNEILSFKALQGKVVFINFWYKDCPPCMAEMDGLQKLYEKYNNKNIVFVMISMESKNTIKEMVDKYGLNLKMVSAEKDVINSWGIVRGYPSSFVINKKGKIIYGRVGGMPDVEKATKDVLEYFGPVIESNINL